MLVDHGDPENRWRIARYRPKLVFLRLHHLGQLWKRFQISVVVGRRYLSSSVQSSTHGSRVLSDQQTKLSLDLRRTPSSRDLSETDVDETPGDEKHQFQCVVYCHGRRCSERIQGDGKMDGLWDVELRLSDAVEYRRWSDLQRSQSVSDLSLDLERFHFERLGSEESECLSRFLQTDRNPKSETYQRSEVQVSGIRSIFRKSSLVSVVLDTSPSKIRRD